MGRGTSKVGGGSAKNTITPQNVISVGTGGTMPEIGFYIDDWFLNKNKPLLAVASASDYSYSIINESEKAIQLKIDSKRRSPLKGDWLQWIPKSAINTKAMAEAKKKETING